MKRILVIGGGFAGLWAALAAARHLDEQGATAGEVEIALINRDRWHAIRVRNYETDLSDVRVPLADSLDPAGVRLVVGEVEAIDTAARTVSVAGESLPYDRLIVAAGSAVDQPPLPGLAEHGFAIDTYDEAAALAQHVDTLKDRPASPGRDTVLIVGAGLTGVELACEMPDRLRAAGIKAPRVIIVDRLPHLGSDMGDEARPVIEEALGALGAEGRTGVSVATVDAAGVTLDDGTRIDTATVVWTAGMRASPLAAMLGVARDGKGRVSVDPLMRVDGLDGVFAAGDIAAAPFDGGHASVMSCQHARPMGRFAGHNAAVDLIGGEQLAMEITGYATCLDLGPWGALYTQGWDRRVAAQGAEVKTIKMTINRERIYPPRPATRAALLEAAAPEVQATPAIGGSGKR